MVDLIGPKLGKADSGEAPAKGKMGTGEGGQSVFAQLLARLGNTVSDLALASDEVPTQAIRTISFPGGATRQSELRDALSSQIDALTAAQVPTDEQLGDTASPGMDVSGALNGNLVELAVVSGTPGPNPLSDTEAAQFGATLAKAAPAATDLPVSEISAQAATLVTEDTNGQLPLNELPPTSQGSKLPNASDALKGNAEGTNETVQVVAAGAAGRIPSQNEPGFEGQVLPQMVQELQAASRDPKAAVASAPQTTDLSSAAEKLGALLQQFDDAHGSDSRAVLTQNIAASGAALPETVRSNSEFFALARRLLGLVQSDPRVDNNPVSLTANGTAITSAAGVETVKALLERAAQPREIQSPQEVRLALPGHDLPSPRPAEAAPQPPAPPSTPASTQTAGFAANLAGQIRGTRLAEGTTRIELAPRGLGGIEIDLATDDNGGLKVTIRAENPGVLGALRDNREALLAVLRDGGTTVPDTGLGFESFGGGGRQERSEPKDPELMASIAEEETVPAQSVPERLAEGRIDIIT